MNYSKYGAKASIRFYLIYDTCHESAQKDSWQKVVAKKISLDSTLQNPYVVLWDVSF